MTQQQGKPTANQLYKRTRKYFETQYYSVKQTHNIITRYAKSVAFEPPAEGRTKEWLQVASVIIQNDWNAFMKFFLPIRGEYSDLQKRKQAFYKKKERTNKNVRR